MMLSCQPLVSGNISLLKKCSYLPHFWIRNIVLKLIGYFSVIIPGFYLNMNHQADKVGNNSLRDRRKTGVGREREKPRKKRERELTLSPKSSHSPSPFHTCHGSARSTLASLLGGLSNDDGDRKKKKAIGLDWQNNNFARASRTFLCCRCTTTKWTCLILRFVEDVNTRELLSFSFPELWYSILEFHYKKNCQHLRN